MNFENLVSWVAGIAIGFSLVGALPQLQTWIWKAQAHVVREARTSTWGSPRFFPEQRE